MIYEHPVAPPSAEAVEADRDAAMREFTQRCTDVLEMYVRRHPDLWLWMHRRWRESSPGVASVEGTPGMFPRPRAIPSIEHAHSDRFAELPGRRRDGLAGDRRRAARPSRREDHGCGPAVDCAAVRARARRRCNGRDRRRA